MYLLHVCGLSVSSNQIEQTSHIHFMGAFLADLSTNLLFQDPLVSWMRTKKQIAIDWI